MSKKRFVCLYYFILIISCTTHSVQLAFPGNLPRYFDWVNLLWFCFCFYFYFFVLFCKIIIIMYIHIIKKKITILSFVVFISFCRVLRPIVVHKYIMYIFHVIILIAVPAANCTQQVPAPIMVRHLQCL